MTQGIIRFIYGFGDGLFLGVLMMGATTILVLVPGADQLHTWLQTVAGEPRASALMLSLVQGLALGILIGAWRSFKGTTPL